MSRWAIEQIENQGGTMLKKFRQRLAGVLTFEDMARRSENYLEDAMNSEEQRSSHIALQQLNGNL
jgi:hypothetical protein